MVMILRIIWPLLTGLLLSVLLSPLPAHAQYDSPDNVLHNVVGSWEGLLEAGLTELHTVFHLDADGDSLTALMDSPDQGAIGIPVSDATFQDDRLRLTVTAVGGRYEGTLVVEADSGRSIQGSWSQMGQSFPLTLHPTDASVALRVRPQQPEPPYPYRTNDVTFDNSPDGIQLGGTLSLPDGGGPHPAVVLVSGSGPQDRDATLFEHKPFLVLADHLTRAGIAVLRYDERGVGASSGTPFPTVTTEAFARDAAAAVRFLKAHPDVRVGSVGLIGLSEGGVVGPQVHVNHESLAFLVLLAAPGQTGYDTLVDQLERIAAAQGMPAALAETSSASQRQLLQAVRTAPDSAAAQEVAALLKEGRLPDEQVDAQVAQLTSPWFRYFVAYDPVPALQQLDLPVLALYGSNDLQVHPDIHARPLRDALSATPDATVSVLDGLNHLFQSAATGLPTEYGQIETTIAPEALRQITTWIQERTALP